MAGIAVVELLTVFPYLAAIITTVGSNASSPGKVFLLSICVEALIDQFFPQPTAGHLRLLCIRVLLS